MGLDTFVLEKLNCIRRNFDALTERLADPDISSNRQIMLSLSRERSASEDTVTAYLNWQKLEVERAELLEMDRNADGDQELRDMVREEARQQTIELEGLEKKIMLLLLPKDPNDDRNVMLEVRSGT